MNKDELQSVIAALWNMNTVYSVGGKSYSSKQFADIVRKVDHVLADKVLAFGAAAQDIQNYVKGRLNETK